MLTGNDKNLETNSVDQQKKDSSIINAGLFKEERPKSPVERFLDKLTEAETKFNNEENIQQDSKTLAKS